MTTLSPATVALDDESTVSWGAVIAGAIGAAAFSLFLLMLGVGLGLSSISPWTDQGISAGTFKAATGVYLVAVAMLSSTVGGYLAGRLRRTWAGVHTDEIYFRDTAHGLLAWAVATLLSATVLATTVTHIIGGAASGVATAAVGAANTQSQPTDLYVDALLRTDPAQTDAAQSGPGSRSEVARIFSPVLTNGDINADDRAYLEKVISQQTGLSQQDAEKRLSDTVSKAKAAIDTARKATAQMMLWLAASLLAGALASMLGATEGGVLRDSKWYEPGWRGRGRP